MSIYTGSKSGPGALYPENAVDADKSRMEPLIDPNQMESRYLWGIPLVSKMKDPVTNRPAKITPEQMQDLIDGAVSTAEAECHIDISPVRRQEKQAFDRNAYESFGFFKTNHRPVATIDKVAVTPASNTDVYSLPLEWVETAYLPRGQVNIIPMTAAFIQGGFTPSGSTGGAFFMSAMGNRSWVPAYWMIEYTSGYKDNMVPRLINDLIGAIVALEILGMLAATYAQTQSHSLGIDGLSQSVSTPGPQIFAVRMQQLEEKRGLLVKKIKKMHGLSLFSSHV